MNYESCVATALASAMVVCAAGCGSADGIELTDVSGAATFQGKPIVYGQVEFYPRDKSAPVGFADIFDGTYDTRADGGKGVLPGPHEIRVSAYTDQPLDGFGEDETVEEVETTVSQPLFLGFAIEADVAGTAYDIVVPEQAAGFGLD